MRAAGARVFGQKCAGAAAFTQMGLEHHPAFRHIALLDRIISASTKATEFGGLVQGLTHGATSELRRRCVGG
jgi:hypothetical protein